MALTNDLKHAMLAAAASAITHLGLGNSGGELSSGGDYARVALDGMSGRPAWDTPSNGAMDIDASANFDVDGGSTVDRVLLRDSGTIGMGTDYGSVDVTEEVFGGDGTYELTSLTLTLTDPA